MNLVLRRRFKLMTMIMVMEPMGHQLNMGYVAI